MHSQPPAPADHPTSQAPHPARPPPIQDPAAALPSNVATIVLHKAGPHTRLVSRTYRDLHPPLLSIFPHGTFTPAGLQAALATLPPSTTSLDLRATSFCQVDHNNNNNNNPGLHVAHNAPHPIQPATAATIAAALPNLQQLTLPPLSASTSPAIFQALQGCPSLHTLHLQLSLCSHAAVLPLNPAHHPPPGAPHPWVPFFTSPLATRLRSLTLPTEALPPLAAAPPNALPHLTHLSILNKHAPPLHPSHLAPLPAAAPTLCSLAVNIPAIGGHQLQLTNCLHAFTQLSALKLTYVSSQDPVGELLILVGALTTLRCLSINLHRKGWTTSEAGWLPRLTRLTCLTINYIFSIGRWGPAQSPVETIAPVALDLAASAARLPHLQRLELHLEATPRYIALLPSDSWRDYFRHLAAATQLRHLSLRHPLPPTEASVLTSLRSLTSLHLHEPSGMVVHLPAAAVTCLLAALPDLQLFSRRCPSNTSTPTSEEAAWQAPLGLRKLHTLALQVGPEPELCFPAAQLLAVAAGRLERLQLAGVPLGLPQGVLGGMARLRLLDLRLAVPVPGGDVLARVVQHLGVPASLRVCFVAEVHADGEELGRLQAAYPLVAFRPHIRPDFDEW